MISLKMAGLAPSMYDSVDYVIYCNIQHQKTFKNLTGWTTWAEQDVRITFLSLVCREEN